VWAGISLPRVTHDGPAYSPRRSFHQPTEEREAAQWRTPKVEQHFM